MKEKTQNILIFIASLIILIVIISFALKMIINYNPEIKENQNQVADIIDGDTFRLENGDVVRLLCVDTPEKGEEGYDEAISFLGGRLLYQDNITLEGNTTDRYNRLLRWVWVDDSLINKEIIDEGFGKVFEDDGEDCGVVM